jgi:hypothetical protein
VLVAELAAGAGLVVVDGLGLVGLTAASQPAAAWRVRPGWRIAGSMVACACFALVLGGIALGVYEIIK